MGLRVVEVVFMRLPVIRISTNFKIIPQVLFLFSLLYLFVYFLFFDRFCNSVFRCFRSSFRDFVDLLSGSAFDFSFSEKFFFGVLNRGLRLLSDFRFFFIIFVLLFFVQLVYPTS